MRETAVGGGIVEAGFDAAVVTDFWSDAAIKLVSGDRRGPNG